MRRTFSAELAEMCTVDKIVQAECDSCTPPPAAATNAEERQLTLHIPAGGVKSTDLATLFDTWSIHVTSIRVALFGGGCCKRVGDEILEIVVGGYPIVSVDRELARLVAEPDGSVELMQFVKSIPPIRYCHVQLVYRSSILMDALVATVTARVIEETPPETPSFLQKWLIDCPLRADYCAVKYVSPPPRACVATVACLLDIPMHTPTVIQSFTVHAAVGSLPPVRRFTLVLDKDGRSSRSFRVPGSMVWRATMPSGEGYYKICLERCISFSKIFSTRLLVQFEEQPLEPVKVVVGMATKRVINHGAGLMYTWWYD